MDFGGIVLFSGGLILFLLGLSWGGELYPWGSARVIATLVVGLVVLVIFVLYGKIMPVMLNALDLTVVRDIHAASKTSHSHGSVPEL